MLMHFMRKFLAFTDRPMPPAPQKTLKIPFKYLHKDEKEFKNPDVSRTSFMDVKLTNI